MAPQIILLSQKFSFEKLATDFPRSGKLTKKVFFQAELRSLTDGNATFAIIAYPAWREKNKWVIGNKVEAEDMGNSQPIPFNAPLALANNELLLGVKKVKNNDKKAKNCENDPAKEFRKLVRKVFQDPELAKKSFFTFIPGISKNPHIELNVTLNAGGATANAFANPCPPAKPAEADAEA